MWVGVQGQGAHVRCTLAPSASPERSEETRVDTFLPSRFGQLDDEGAFELPIPGLFADLESGHGSVALTDAFAGAPPHIRVKILRHWLRALDAQSDSSIVAMFREFSGPLQTMTIVEQIKAFRSFCREQGIGCPPDLPLLLQRF